MLTKRSCCSLFRIIQWIFIPLRRSQSHDNVLSSPLRGPSCCYPMLHNYPSSLLFFVLCFLLGPPVLLPVFRTLFLYSPLCLHLNFPLNIQTSSLLLTLPRTAFNKSHFPTNHWVVDWKLSQRKQQKSSDYPWAWGSREERLGFLSTISRGSG